MDYETYIQSADWRIKANEAKKRAGWSCAVCASTKSLEVHHRTYLRLGHERPSDLVVLCWRCHRTHHGTLEDVRVRELEYDELTPFQFTFPRGNELN